MKTKFSLLAVLLILAFVLGACATAPAATAAPAAPAEPTKKPLKIGFSHCNLTILWMAELQTHVEKKAKELGVELVITNANDDKNKQVTDVENLISQGVDGLLIVPVDSNAAITLVEKAQAAKLPVAVASRAIASDYVLTFATGDDLEAGRLVGQYFADKLGGKGNIVFLPGPLGLNPVILRSQGFKEILAKYPDMKIVAEQVADNNRAKAVTVMENILTANPKIDAVFGTNDEMALGAFIAMKAAGRENEALIATVGGHMETFTSIKNGEMDGCVFYPNTMGARAFELLVDFLNGKTVPKKEVVPSALITKENVDQYIAALK